MLLKEALKNCEDILKKCTINFKNECMFLVEALLNIPRAEIPIKKEISDKEYKKLKKACCKRSKGIPLQLIIGYSDFYNVRIIESRHTLKPRPETEALVEMVISDYANDISKNKSISVLDMCAGSGCIGLALKKAGFSEVTLVDYSKKAIKQCKENAKINKLDIEVIKSDMFNHIASKYDIIVCNPPYIKTDDIKYLQKEVKKYDPLMALDGGQDGLKFYRTIASESSKYLLDTGVLYLEIGQNQENEVVNLLQSNYKNITILKDFNGINRYIRAEKC